MGIDEAGNIAYCTPGKSSYDSSSLPPPDTNWGKIVSVTTYGDTLYVLDPQVNAVWYFNGDKGRFENTPSLFFDEQVPQMNDVVDLAVDQEFLYLLHSDGRMTICEASGFEFSPTRCTDPIPYGDARVGQEASPLSFSDAHFLEMQATQPPDPSLYILDDAHASIYHLSLRRLNLQRQYRPEVDPDSIIPSQKATAFAITPNRRALIAFGSQVFWATIP